MADLPRVMRAVVPTGHGGLDKLAYSENWPRVRPGPGQALVELPSAPGLGVAPDEGWFGELWAVFEGAAS